MKSKVILLNGPPAVGKDTIADYLVENHGFVKRSFKKQLIRCVAALYSLEEESVFEMIDDRSIKEKQLDIFNGKSPREVFIHVSERIIKPNFGKDYFGLAAAKSIEKPANYVFSDSGFIDEMKALERVTDDIMLVHMYREGTDWGNDSRRYLPDNSCKRFMTLHNDSTVEYAGEAVNDAFKILLV
jgi:hypothetical protein